MPKIELFGGTIGLLEKVLDLRMQNQQVISSNIANANTPGYVPSRMEFEEDLRNALSRPRPEVSRTNPRHFDLGGGSVPQVQGKLIKAGTLGGMADDNRVNVDKEMINMAENQMLYEAATQIISKKLAKLRYLAQDGK